MGRQITILGMGPTAYERKIGILDHCIGEKWSLNNAYVFFEGLKFDRFFELHKYDYLKTWNPGHSFCHFDQLNKLGCPIYVMEPLPKVRNQVDYNPVEVFRHHDCNYFLGSPSLMLALALYEHEKGDIIDEIRVWGVDTSDPSHAQQRSSWAYWCGRCMAAGITFSGSGLDYMAEYEKDDGLRGLREAIGDNLHLKSSEQE